jgi:hypothetical protein
MLPSRSTKEGRKKERQDISVCVCERERDKERRLAECMSYQLMREDTQYEIQVTNIPLFFKNKNTGGLRVG